MQPRDLDTWHSERALERAAAPARHAVAAWLLAALLVAVGVFGQPATHEAALGIGELRHEAGTARHANRQRRQPARRPPPRRGRIRVRPDTG